MSNSGNLKQEIQDLVDKTIEVNKVFINEGAGLLKQLSIKDNKKAGPSLFQGDFLSKAISAYASLNIQHLKNMMDLGVSLAHQAVQSQDTQENTTETPAENLSEPSFILEQTIKAGGAATLQFLMDNDKRESVEVTFLHTDFVNYADDLQNKQFRTTFQPAQFNLAPAGAQQVDIKVQVPKKTAPGLYISKVQVKGFEPAYFSIHIEVT